MAGRRVGRPTEATDTATFVAAQRAAAGEAQVVGAACPLPANKPVIFKPGADRLPDLALPDLTAETLGHLPLWQARLREEQSVDDEAGAPQASGALRCTPAGLMRHNWRVGLHGSGQALTGAVSSTAVQGGL